MNDELELRTSEVELTGNVELELVARCSSLPLVAHRSSSVACQLPALPPVHFRSDRASGGRSRCWSRIWARTGPPLREGSLPGFFSVFQRASSSFGPEFGSAWR